MSRNLILNLVVLSLFSIGNIYAQTNGVWVTQYSGTSSLLIGVSAVDDDTAFVCGVGGAFLKTTNGGATWTSVSSGTLQDFYAMDFVNSSHGILVGNNGTIRRTWNGGLNWTPTVMSSAHMRSVRYVNQDTVFAGGANGELYKSIDGGVNWSASFSGTTSTIYGIGFFSSLIGYATCFNGSVLKTVDCGSSWTAFPTGVTTKLNQIHFLDSLTGIVVGDAGVILRTTDGGITWNTVVMPPFQSDFGGLQFIDSLNGFVSGFSGSQSGVVLVTNDGGQTWSANHYSGVSLTGLDFANPNTGYVVGYSGTIKKYTTSTGLNYPVSVNANMPFPNPAKDVFSLGAGTLTGDVLIRITDSMGRVVRSETISLVSQEKLIKIEVSDLRAGQYCLIAGDASASIVTRFVKL